VALLLRSSPSFASTSIGSGHGSDLARVRGPEGRPAAPRQLPHRVGAGTPAVGLDEMHFHDYADFPIHVSAATGATTAEIMRRAGHKSAAAAMRYRTRQPTGTR